MLFFSLRLLFLFLFPFHIFKLSLSLSIHFHTFTFIHFNNNSTMHRFSTILRDDPTQRCQHVQHMASDQRVNIFFSSIEKFFSRVFQQLLLKISIVFRVERHHHRHHTTANTISRATGVVAPRDGTGIKTIGRTTEANTVPIGVVRRGSRS